MALRELILIFLLQFKAGISGDHYLYHRLGNDAILPCDIAPSDASCPSHDWLYNRHSDSTTTSKVRKGKVNQNSPGGARLSLSSSCSLTIINITAEDAGRYVCRVMDNDKFDTRVHLNILTIFPPDADPERDDELTLTCSLLRYSGSCRKNSVRWVDEKGTVLLGEDDGYEFNRPTDCDSVLTVKRQGGHNRRFTCQFIEANSVKIDAHYTPVFTDLGADHATGSTSNNTFIIVGAVVGVLVVLVVIAAVLIKYRRRTKVTEDVQKPIQSEDEPGGNLTYITVNHANQKANPKKKVKAEEAVTYSTVKTTVRTEADGYPSSVYSSVR